MDTATPAIYAKNLSYAYRSDASLSLIDVNLSLPKGSRTLIVGANGGRCRLVVPRSPGLMWLLAGKSTLLQILAGKKLVSTVGAEIEINGRDVFRNTPEGITFLGTEWSVNYNHHSPDGLHRHRALNPVVRGDILVSAFLDSVGGYRYKERRDQLLDLLDIDLDWRMHNISDGERRRVQLCFGLMVPWDVLLLDEVLADLLCLK